MRVEMIRTKYILGDQEKQNKQPDRPSQEIGATKNNVSNQKYMKATNESLQNS